MGVCVPNFRSVSLLVWPGDVTQTNTYINTYTHVYTSEFKNILGGCSPHVDFEKMSVTWTFFQISNHLKITLNSLSLGADRPTISRTFRHLPVNGDGNFHFPKLQQ